MKLETESSKLSKKPRFLLKHVGNMGDFVFFVPPVLETLKKKYPDCHITLVTTWGWKDKNKGWGLRNQSGFCISLAMTNPHIDELVHWHDSKLALDGSICIEEGRHFPTWNARYYQQQKASGDYDGAFELDVGIKPTDNPLQRMYDIIGLPDESYSDYKIYLTDDDRAVAQEVMADVLRPRIVLLEAMNGRTTREWNMTAVPQLLERLTAQYGVPPIWFGGRHVPEREGTPLTLRQNIATLELCDVAIGPPSGPLHFAAAVGLPTLTLYCDHQYNRAAPAYFLNQHIDNPEKNHRTLWGPNPSALQQMKTSAAPAELTPSERAHQGWQNWQLPGHQSTKSCLGAITPDEIMTALSDMLPS